MAARRPLRPSDSLDDPTHWLAELRAASQREAHYRKRGKAIFGIYAAQKDGTEEDQSVPFNILYSNTETLLPALYSAVPRPLVERRFRDADPLGRQAGQAAQRGLAFLLDTNREGYQTMHEALEDAVLNALLPGRGEVRIKYDAAFTLPETGDGSPAEEAVPYVADETICAETVLWDRVLYGYAKQWHKVPWLAYEFHLTEAEVAVLLGDAELAASLTYAVASRKKGEEEPDLRPSEDPHPGRRKTARLYQIWDKAGGRKVRYVAPTVKDRILKTEDDPLGLTGFFNMPRPLQLLKNTNSLVPTPLYDLYRTQAQELNRITQRINRIVEAIKARGAYDSNLGDLLTKVMEADDNALVPADVTASLATEKGFANAIWMIPVDTLVAVLRQLYDAREACKQTIFEITGISDIMRGSTQASETATAQRVKNQWGTLRLKRMQREVARFARDLLRLALELAATKLSEETWAAMTGLPFLTGNQLQLLQFQAHTIQASGQPLPPDLQAELARPTWRQVLDLLQNDAQRSYRIDIETNSTVEPEAAEDQTAITSLLTAIGQTLNGLSPLVQAGVMPFQAAQALLLFIARRFRFGSEIEEYITAMQAPPPAQAGQEKTQQLQADLRQQQALLELEKKTQQAQFALTQRDAAVTLKEQQLRLEQDQIRTALTAQRHQAGLEQQRAMEAMQTREQLQQLKEKKYNVEAVVNKKTDTALQSVTMALQQVQTLSEAVRQVQALGEAVTEVRGQVAQTQAMLDHLIRAVSAKRVRTPVRGADGRIVRVDDELAA